MARWEYAILAYNTARGEVKEGQIGASFKFWGPDGKVIPRVEWKKTGMTWHKQCYDMLGKPTAKEYDDYPAVKLMNELGAEGWELVSEQVERKAFNRGDGIVTTREVSVVRTFKREIR